MARLLVLWSSGEKTLFCGAVSMGNPHVVTVVDDVDTADVDTLGPLLDQGMTRALLSYQSNRSADLGLSRNVYAS